MLEGQELIKKTSVNLWGPLDDKRIRHLQIPNPIFTPSGAMN